MEETPFYPEFPETPKWYDKDWYVVLVLVLLWSLGLYGLIKSQSKKGILLKFFGLIAIVLCVYVVKNPDLQSSYDSRFDGAVKNSYFDGSVDVAERYLKNNLLRDPSSYESVTWSKVTKNSDGTYQVTYHARNGFGGTGKETTTFIISSDGQRVISHY